ncbi:hypothetical protein BN1723_013428, partial [Verticillium longisporum]
QTCQEGSGDDAPYECADPLFETTESAFALVPLSRQIESIIAENSLFISSLTAELSLTLTFTPITTLPDPFEPTTVSNRPVITVPSTPPATTTPPPSTSAATSTTQDDDDTTETGETSVRARSTTSTTSREISTSSKITTTETESATGTASTSVESSSSSAASTVSEESDTVTSTLTASISTETSTLSGPVTTTSSQGAAPTAQSQWQHGMAVIGLVMAAVL